MPTLVTSYFVQSATSGDSTTLSTPAFTPSNGEVLVIKAATWDTGTPSGTPSGGSLTYTRQSTGAPGGFAGYCTIFTAAVVTSPGSMSVTLSAPAGSCYHSMTVERWASAKLAGSPATNSTVHGGSGPPSVTITTTASNSVISWVSVDENSSDPTGRTYLSAATEDGLADGHTSTSSVHYYAYQAAASAGSQTVGMSTPANQNWTITGIEIQHATIASTSPPGAFMPFFS
ncbi:MAG TPA: hypothetical protein VLF59_02060 [Candidatus Saccharimonadales bacterium]|nr:hypothetical protein [Candidatus Saccharimonadales bacterium]